MISPALRGFSLGLSGAAAPLDGRLADAVLEAEGCPPGRELVAVLTPDHLHAGKVLLRRRARSTTFCSRSLSGEMPGDGNVHLGRAKWLLPVLRAALSGVAQVLRARRHALPELGREAVERGLWHAECLQALVCEGDGDPGVLRGIRGRSSGVHDTVESPHQLASGGAFIDAQQQVGADIRRGALVERPGSGCRPDRG